MELWLTDVHTGGYSVNWKVLKTYHREKTDYQDLAIVELEEFGRALILDGIVQTTIADEFVYHEMLTHIGMFTHPNPENVLVVGGGDGGIVREVLKHPAVKKVTLCEIDGRVVDLCRQYLPEISCGLDDPRVEIKFADGIKYINESPNTFDVILVDSSDPIGPALGLYARDFYKGIHDALKEDGLFVAQTESPVFNRDLLREVFAANGDIFPLARVYLSAVCTYIGGFWSFTLGSKKYDPLQRVPSPADVESFNCRYYNTEIHRGAFALPNFVQDVLR